jgi:hypothetical protein
LKAAGSGVSTGTAVLTIDVGSVCSGLAASVEPGAVVASTVASESDFVAVAFASFAGVGVATMIHGVCVGCMPDTPCAQGVVVTITILGV